MGNKVNIQRKSSRRKYKILKLNNLHGGIKNLTECSANTTKALVDNLLQASRNKAASLNQNSTKTSMETCTDASTGMVSHTSTASFPEVSDRPIAITMTETKKEVVDEEVPLQHPEDVECRACLQRFDYEAGLLDMFQAWDPPWNGMGESIAQDLTQITNVEVSPADSYSKLICQFCHQRLLDACSFVVNVRINDRLLRQRAETLHEPEHTWPKPIQVDRNINSNIFNTPMDVEIKQEVLSEDETYSNCPEDAFKDGADVADGTDNAFNSLEIKIEPEEIMRPTPYQIMVNGTITDDQYEQNSILVNGDHKPTEQDETFIQLLKKRKKLGSRNKTNNCTIVTEIDPMKEELHFYGGNNPKDCDYEPDNLSNDSHISLIEKENSALHDNQSSVITTEESFRNLNKDYNECVEPQLMSDTDGMDGNIDEISNYNGITTVNVGETINVPNENHTENNIDKYGRSKKSPRITSTACLNGSSFNSNVDKKEIELDKRKLKAPCSCILKCYERVPYGKRLAIFNYFWNKCNSWEQRFQFIINNVSIIQKHMIKIDGYFRRKRKVSYVYRLIVDSKSEEVCRVMFLNTLSIGINFIKLSFTKPLDKRSVMDRSEKYIPCNQSPEVVNSVIEHINSYINDISLLIKDARKFLETDFNITTIYKLYTNFMARKGVQPNLVAKKWLYRKIFKNKFNLSFKMPPLSTCDDCDNYKRKLIYVKDETAKEIIERDKRRHDEDVEERYNLKSQDIYSAKENPTAKKVLIFDLEQFTVTTNETAKHWTLNLTIFDLTNNNAANIMWSDDIGGKSGNEVASSLIRWTEETNKELSTVRDLTLWSDNCPEMNLNLALVMAYMWLLHKNAHLRVINHKFMIKGHTHIEIDEIHSQIDRLKKHYKSKQILIPQDQPQLIQTCEGNGTYVVYDMRPHDFKDFSSLHKRNGPFVNRKRNVYGEDFKIHECVWLQLRQDQPGALFYKKTFSQEFSAIFFHRNTWERELFPNDLPILRPSVRDPYPRQST